MFDILFVLERFLYLTETRNAVTRTAKYQFSIAAVVYLKLMQFNFSLHDFIKCKKGVIKSSCFFLSESKIVYFGSITMKH